MSDRPRELIDADGFTTPQCRARILASVLRHVSQALHPFDVHTLLLSVQEEIGLSEEGCSSEITRSIFLLCRAGLITDDYFDGKSLTIGMDNTLRPSRSVTGYIWEDETGE